MPEIRPDADSVIGTGSLARLLGISEQQVRKLTARNTLRQLPDQRGKYGLIENVHRYTENLREAAAGRTLPEQLAQARLVKAKADAATATMNAKRMQGTLLEASAIEGRWNAAARILRSNLLATSSRIANRLNLNNENKAVVADEINHCLNDIADSGREKTEILEYQDGST